MVANWTSLLNSIELSLNNVISGALVLFIEIFRHFRIAFGLLSLVGLTPGAFIIKEDPSGLLNPSRWDQVFFTHDELYILIALFGLF